MARAVAFILAALLVAAPASASTTLYIQNVLAEAAPAALQGGWLPNGDITAAVSGSSGYGETPYFKCATTKSGAIASTTNTESVNINDWAMLTITCVGDTFDSNQSVGGAGTTMSWVLGTEEDNALMNANWRVHGWVMKPDGTSRGTFTSSDGGTTAGTYLEGVGVNKWPSNPQGAKNNGTTVALSPTAISAIAGDRPVFEIGCRLLQNANALYYCRNWIGGTSGTDLTVGGDETAFPGHITVSQNWSLGPLPTATPTVTPTGDTPTPTRTPTSTMTPTSTPTGFIRTFVVNTLADAHDGDTGDGFCSTSTLPCGGNGICTLRAAVEQANASVGTDAIEVPDLLPASRNGSVYKIGDLDEIAVTDAVVITGTGTDRGRVTLEPHSGAGRFFNVSSAGSLELVKLTLREGRGPGQSDLEGAGIRNAGILILNNVHTYQLRNLQTQANLLDDSSGTVRGGNGGKGGAVFNDTGGFVYTTNGTLLETGVSNWGGCGFNDVGGVWTSTDTEFDDCHVQGLDEESSGEGHQAGGGGGLMNLGVVTLQRVTFDFTRVRLCIGGGGLLNGDDGDGYTGCVGPGDCAGTGPPLSLGPGGVVNADNVTFVETRARRGQGGWLTMFGGTFWGRNVSFIRGQSKDLSSLILNRDENQVPANFHCSHCLIAGQSISDPSFCYQNCWDDGTTVFDVDNSMDDSCPSDVMCVGSCPLGSGEHPITCPGFQPMQKLCIGAEGDYGGVGPEYNIEVARPDTSGCGGHAGDRSPAIDGGTATCTLTDDARGMSRPLGAACDIGAVEIE